jgi:DMSO/TMAO reductase YedYZ molybdopterin-dependent catalytic subunit
MPRSPAPDRRRFLTRGLAALGALSLAGCEPIGDNARVISFLSRIEGLTRRAQRLVLGQALAPEFTEADLSPDFRANGTTDPQDDAYLDLVDNNFADWRLKVDGLVETPAQLSLAELRAMPSRTQITRHDCVEGWSCIGKWKGVPLAMLLAKVKPKPEARYVVFHCADTMDDSAKYYESIDLFDAAHPQTILAYDMNDKTLTVPHGAPLRLRVERQLGYKMAKYIMRIELTDKLAGIGDGKGGYWEDQGYEWYAGI